LILANIAKNINYENRKRFKRISLTKVLTIKLNRMKIKYELDKKEVDLLFKLKNKKNISNIQIAKHFDYAHSTISGLFNKYISSKSTFENIKNYIINSDFNYVEIKQNHYGLLEIDTREKDILIIAMVEKTETNIIQVERCNLKKLIKILKSEL